ncbi:ATP-dependent acyl-CoA ligase [Pseudolabrys sp. FHR47]|uniref:ATP-dependent acyl-CoA ligase n=1 Tax=Pseudolabrys sp. FHR47 TaxID=2562284 RepID=UPI0010BE3B8D|nr:ATP-dependent acyl-CoA ligase [Pseudolabrys sp. FHR47]
MSKSSQPFSSEPNPAAAALVRQLSQSFAPGDRTVPAMLTRQAVRYGDKPLVGFGDRSWTYAQTRDEAAAFGATLLAAGIKKGDRVALICSNRFEFIRAFLGCAWIGAVSVPINTASRGHQLQHILTNSAARLLIVEGQFAGNLKHLDFAALPLETIWTIDADKPLQAGKFVSQPVPAARATCEAAVMRPRDMLTILYTSGTTGPSKGVCCPHAQYFWWGANTAALLSLSGDDRLQSTLPLFHTNALNTFFQAMLMGISVVYEKRFSASDFYAALTRSQATATYVLGAMVPILLSRARSPEESAHKVKIALAPGVPARFHEEFTERTGIKLVDGWGSTETNFAIGTTWDRQRPGTMGTVFAGFEARVVDGDDNDVPDGEPGELLVRANEPFAFATGYFAAPEKTVEAWQNLWFHTGDRVVRESDGYFRFVDRIKDAIRRRGENISSFEVEQVLLSHPAVALAAAFPVRSSLAEDEVMIAAVLHPGQTLNPLDLIQYCEPRLPYFAVPRYVDIVDVLPTTENGKVQKYKLTERGVTAQTWDREAAGYKVKRT